MEYMGVAPFCENLHIEQKYLWIHFNLMFRMIWIVLGPKQNCDNIVPIYNNNWIHMN